MTYWRRNPGQASPYSMNNMDLELDWEFYVIEEALRNDKVNLNPVQEVIKSLYTLLRTRNLMLYPGFVQGLQEEVKALRTENLQIYTW